MAIDLEKLGLTRRAQVMLGVLAVMAAGYFILHRYPLID